MMVLALRENLFFVTRSLEVAGIQKSLSFFQTGTEGFLMQVCIARALASCPR
jgi:hypothetical protein